MTSTDIEAPVDATFPTASIPVPTTLPATPKALAARDWKRLAVSASAPVSLADRPSAATWIAAPDPSACARRPEIRPEMPPLVVRLDRNDAPDAVPGSEDASSGKSAIGQKQAIAKTAQPTTAIPTLAALALMMSPPASEPPVVVLASGNEAREICHPRPPTSASSGEVRHAATNRRIDFHIHERVPSPNAPAAAIGMV